MPQLSLYVDRLTLNTIEKYARKSKVSISRWVAEHIKTVLKREFPEDYFGLFGSIKDSTFKRPVQPGFRNDIRREKI